MRLILRYDERMNWMEQQALEIEALAQMERDAEADKAFQATLLAKPVKTAAKLSNAVVLPDSDDVRELARAATPQAIKALIEIVQDSDASYGARISAASALLDRAHGKPHQSVDMQAAIKHMFEPLVIKAVDYGKVIEG